MTDSLDPTELMSEFAREFDEKCIERHEFGQEKYGPFSFLGKDMIQEALLECLDTANYMRYQYIKLRMVQLYLAQDPRLAGLADSEGNITIGAESFKGALQ